MAATKAELLLAEPPACVPPPLSPLDGYSKLEELRLLLQNAAAGGSLLAAEAAGLLSGEPGEDGGEERTEPTGTAGGRECFEVMVRGNRASSPVHMQTVNYQKLSSDFLLIRSLMIQCYHMLLCVMTLLNNPAALLYKY